MVAIFVFFSCLALVTAEHSGAYSSPQYAKKLYPRVDTNAVLPHEKPPVPFKKAMDRFDSVSNDTSQYARSSILNSAGSFFSGAGGQIVTNLAKDVIARSTGSSQVLSLNLTNLVILIVLKALILAAGFFGAGAWKGGHHYGRSLDGEDGKESFSIVTNNVVNNTNASYISEDEILLYMSYLVGQQTQHFGCLYRLSCQKPEQAAMYSSGADILLQGAKLLQGNSLELESYADISKGIKEAAAWGEEGLSCDTRYQCGE